MSFKIFKFFTFIFNFFFFEIYRFYNFTKIKNRLKIMDDSSLFNIHEKWGILIAFICFIAGFPSNLLSICVCLRSLLDPNYTSGGNNNHQRQTSSLNRKASINNPKRRISSAHNKQRVTTTLPTATTTIIASTSDSIAQSNSLKRKSALIAANSASQPHLLLSPPSKQRNGHLSSYNRFVNPHRKCFELYLIEISICDLIILTYHFIEWVLLILSRYNLIDKLYSEPIYISSFMCRFAIALNRTIILLHNWLVALLALTRCYAIYKPFNKHTLYNSKFYCRLNLYFLFILLTLFIGLNIFGVALMTYTKTDFNSTNYTFSNDNSSGYSSINSEFADYKVECKLNPDLYKRFKYLDFYINLSIGIIGYSLPLAITFFINLVLIFNLRQLLLYRTNRFILNTTKTGDETEYVKTKKRSPRFSLFHKSSEALDKMLKSGSKNTTATTVNTTLNSNVNRMKFFKTTSSLLLISFSYLICYIPFTFTFLLLSLEQLRINVNLIFIFTNLRYLNHTLNFFIYYATGKRFRSDVRRFINCN